MSNNSYPIWPLWPHYQLGAVLTVLGTLIGAGGTKIAKAREP
jgi:predicted anti-sigma-YlaC factor YlaD